MPNNIKLDRIITNPLYDNRVKSHCYYIQIAIKDYLSIVDMDSNIFQRSLLKSKLYKKLITDILEGAIFPAISVVYPSKIDLTIGLDTTKKFQILDGLQRTNCLLICKAILNNTFNDFDTTNIKIIYKNEDEFLDKLITVEIWEELTLRSILYKIVVLNTGQKRMDTSHQLDILLYSLQDTLLKDNIKVIRQTEKEREKIDFSEIISSNTYPLSDIAESLVSYIANLPTYSSQTAADYLFENLNLSDKEFDNILNMIENENTYNDLVWVLKDFGNKILEKYGDNIMIKYNIFLTGLMAALGLSRKIRDSELLKNKLSNLLNKFDNSIDPLNLSDFEIFYKKFVSGIGVKRRKLVYTTFKNYFGSKLDEDLNWKEAYSEIEGVAK